MGGAPVGRGSDGLGALDRKFEIGRETHGTDRRRGGMTYDLDVPRLLVQGRGDASRDRLEGVKHGGLSGLEGNEIADPDDYKAPGLIRGHDTGGSFPPQPVANPPRPSDGIGRGGGRGRRGRRADGTLS